MYIPNAFTPNGDNKNDVFLPVIRSVKKYSLQIFNRWGQKIFETRDYAQGWDGVINGEACVEETYSYKIILTALNGDFKETTGSVLLYR
jgi:gliding motility-associated-like protein